MTQDEIAALIPANVVEAALKAYSGNSCECSSCRKAVIRTLAAGLAAWEGILQMSIPDPHQTFFMPDFPQVRMPVLVLHIEEPKP